MTTETNSVLNTVKEAFAPVTEAFTKLQNMEVPEAAREFVKKQAETAKVRAADMHAGSEKVTAAIETAAVRRLSRVRAAVSPRAPRVRPARVRGPCVDRQRRVLGRRRHVSCAARHERHEHRAQGSECDGKGKDDS